MKDLFKSFNLLFKDDDVIDTLIYNIKNKVAVPLKFKELINNDTQQIVSKFDGTFKLFTANDILKLNNVGNINIDMNMDGAIYLDNVNLIPKYDLIFE